jgi:hypothetical protein
MNRIVRAAIIGAFITLLAVFVYVESSGTKVIPDQATIARDRIIAAYEEQQGRHGGLDLLELSIIFWVSLAVYFVPSVIAHSRHKRNSTAILMLNIFGGWTIVGWVVALV